MAGSLPLGKARGDRSEPVLVEDSRHAALALFRKLSDDGESSRYELLGRTFPEHDMVCSFHSEVCVNMARHQFQQGELAYWLQIIAEQGAQAQVPESFADALLTLRCVERAADGQLLITEKGRLALHMEGPGAIHRH